MVCVRTRCCGCYSAVVDEHLVRIEITGNAVITWSKVDEFPLENLFCGYMSHRNTASTNLCLPCIENGVFVNDKTKVGLLCEWATSYVIIDKLKVVEGLLPVIVAFLVVCEIV